MGQKARLNAFRTADRVVANARVMAPPSRAGLAGESACTVDGIMIEAAGNAIESRIGMAAGLAGSAFSTRPSATATETRDAAIAAGCGEIVGGEMTGGGAADATLKAANDPLKCAIKGAAGRVTA